MKIEHITGTSVETDKLPDVDALLMEESQKLHALFAKYNRQLFLLGEMIGMNGASAANGCMFHHIAATTADDDATRTKAFNMYFGRMDNYIRQMTNNQLGIGNIQPPQVKPYPGSSDV
jgi:folate-dependent tRNA-U54 methylase TrmFO/GidA